MLLSDGHCFFLVRALRERFNYLFVYHIRQHATLRRDRPRGAKVAQLDLAEAVKKDVSRLDVAMHESGLVHVLHGLQQIEQYCFDLDLRQPDLTSLFNYFLEVVRPVIQNHDQLLDWPVVFEVRHNQV